MSDAPAQFDIKIWYCSAIDMEHFPSNPKQELLEYENVKKEYARQRFRLSPYRHYLEYQH